MTASKFSAILFNFLDWVLDGETLAWEDCFSCVAVWDCVLFIVQYIAPFFLPSSDTGYRRKGFT